MGRGVRGAGLHGLWETMGRGQRILAEAPTQLSMFTFPSPPGQPLRVVCPLRSIKVAGLVTA